MRSFLLWQSACSFHGMSTAAAPTTPAAADAKVGLGAILIPVLLSTVLTLVTVGGALFWLVRSGRLGGVSPTVAQPPPTAPPSSHVVVLEPMIVNLADGRSYLRAAVSLRIRDEEKVEKKEEGPKDAKAVDGIVAALRDTTLSVLSNATAESLLAPDGRGSLKKALDAAYREHDKESHVLEIYFTEFLVQRG